MGCIPVKNKIFTNKIYDDKILCYYSFDNFSLIAHGDYGPIYLANYRSTNITYVMKQYKKDKAVLMRSLFSIMNELVFYKKFNNKSNFIVNLKFAFQDFESFYLIQEYVEGGDLRYHMSKRQFTEERSKFVIACVILGLEFLHKIGYVYRNIKPENLIFDKNGYVKLCDFKYLRDASQTNYCDTSGSAGYMAPEILFRQNHSSSSDIFSLGVVAHELMLGKLPYQSEDRKIYRQHLSRELVQIKNTNLPEGWSHISADFINRCIQRRPAMRLGYNGIEELKEHKWFAGFNWNSLAIMQMKTNFSPGNGKNFKPRPKEQIFIEKNLKPYIELLEIKKKFEGYYYDNFDKSTNSNNDDLNKIENIIEKDIDLFDNESKKEEILIESSKLNENLISLTKNYDR